MKKVSKTILFFLILLTLISYACVWISPLDFRWSGILSLFIPVFLVLHLVLLIYYGIIRSPRLWAPLLLLLAGYRFFLVSVGFTGEKENDRDISIFNYNVKWFVEASSTGSLEEAIYWINSMDHDIKCFQEFHASEEVVEDLKQHGKYHAVIAKKSNNLAVFSRWPVIRSGLLFDERRLNNIQYADVVKGPDTLRIYNIHLESMGINVDAIQGTDGIREEYRNVKNRFLAGSIRRATQIKALLDHVDQCSYPVMIAGDFNDVPYSYNYFQLRKKLSNAFEKAGRGFGFTYNGNLPFLRIDHQFYDENFEIHRFITYNKINYSDHFPIVGIYSISK